jgi:exopolysaccharide production protein ExoQ
VTAQSRRSRMSSASRRETGFSFLTSAMAWFMILVIVIPGNLDYSGVAQEGVEGNPVTRALWFAIFGVGVIIVLMQMSQVPRLLRQLNVFYLLFLALAVASLAWSIDRELTGRKLVRMIMMCSAFLAIAIAAWHPRRFQEAIRPVVTAVVFASIVFALARPDLALHHELNAELINAWHGVCLTKNQLGSVASFAFILWTHALLAKEPGRVKAFIGASAAMLCLIMSRSETSTIASVLAAIAMVLMTRTPGSMRRQMPFLTTGLVMLILLYSVAMLNVVPGLQILLAPIPMITGKDLTFSNRAQIWAVVVEHIRYRPLLGSGYGAFWLTNAPTPDKESYFVIQRLSGFYPGSSHNGYLQILNDLGAVGLIFLLGYVMVFLRQSVRLYATDRTQGALFVGLLLQQATLNLQEPNWLNAIIVDFVPMSIATACLARALLEAKSRTNPTGQGMARGARWLPRPPALQRRRLIRPASSPPRPDSGRR